MLTIDDREAVEARDHHQVDIVEAVGIPARVERLDSGDYAFLDRDDEPTGVERCEIGNLIQKLASGELEEQLIRCQDAYAGTILLVEGVYDKVDSLLAVHKGSDRGYFRVRVYPHTRYDYIKALEVRLSELGIEVLHSPNFDCSMSLIRTIYNQRTKPEEEHTLFKKVRAIKLPTKFTKNPAVPRLMALCPRLSEKVALMLVDKYGSIWGVLNAPDADLLEVDGFGKTLLKRLKEGVGKE